MTRLLVSAISFGLGDLLPSDGTPSVDLLPRAKKGSAEVLLNICFEIN